MANNITFTMIKPDAVAAGHIGAILAQINKAGFKIVALKYTKLSAEKSNAIEDFRKLIGATDPAKAAPGTIRALFAKNIGENAVHGSDSDENALIEASFHFSKMEMFR